MAGTPKKRSRRRPNELSADVAAAFQLQDGADFGPKMKALPSDRHRAFVLALYEVPRGYGASVGAAKAAGFGTATTSAKSWSVIGSRLAHDERILEAIREEDERRIRASAPRAIRALGHLIETPDHRDHGRAIGMVMDRVHPVETTHTLKVEDNRRPTLEMTAATIARIVELARALGVPKMPPMIEYQATAAQEPAP